MNFASPAFKIDKDDLAHIFKVCIYSCSAAIFAGLIAALSHLQVAPQYLFLVPIVNTILVALEQWSTNHTQE